MKIQHPALMAAAGATGAAFIRTLLGTCRYHFRYPDPSVNPEVARRHNQRHIYAFFHEVMLFPAYYWAWPSMHILISDHRDGEIITRMVRRLGFTVIRGSTTRGGARALKEMTWRADSGNLCITPDGPRGPRRHVHHGALYAASLTGLPVVGAGIAFKHAWRARSWDRFAVPRPFTPAACVATRPLHVPPSADRDTIESLRAELESRMLAATHEAEAWAAQL